MNMNTLPSINHGIINKNKNKNQQFYMSQNSSIEHKDLN